jgi:hypothetical protein
LLLRSKAEKRMAAISSATVAAATVRPSFKRISRYLRQHATSVHGLMGHIQKKSMHAQFEKWQQLPVTLRRIVVCTNKRACELGHILP